MASLGVGRKGLSAQEAQYYDYLCASYPSNHNYKLYKQQLYPSRDLAFRYKKLLQLYPQPLTSLLDCSVSKGFFVFAAAQIPTCTRIMGIDIEPYNIEVCTWLKAYTQQSLPVLAILSLHELAERINEFGGPFQTVLVINMYQYLYFGSALSNSCYLDHDLIFAHLAKVCSQRVIFSNRTSLADCQNKEQIISAPPSVVNNYNHASIVAAAQQYFTVTAHGKIGKYPLWTLDLK